MNDTTEPDLPLTPAQEAAVRRALAEAGGPEPMPGEVVDRLDAVIADLAGERATALPGGVPEGHPEAPAVVVLDRAARRRRTRVRVLFGAAAAVALVAVGVGTLGNRSSNDAAAGDASTAAEAPADRSDSPEAAPEGSALKSATDDSTTSNNRVPDSVAGGYAAELRRVDTDQPLRRVRPDHLRADLVALQAAVLPDPATADYSGLTLTAPADFMCAAAAFGPGHLVGVEYDGTPAVVAFRKPMGTTQEAEVLSCGTGDVQRSTTLAATG
ncbi:hypothetical protein GCM10022237_32720 [Nocardioides ginsengisoli]|uniref:Uncharacterized protein n=1 Tax=Nocardioides ginsengisoli TaxID=363868 RepID=A0ABW3WA08_9ACTN